MSQRPKLLSSEATVRFQDCDPYGQLYNARYIDYFMNAREDQLLTHYDFDIYELARTRDLGWVVAMNQVAYLEPVTLMERVRITSKIIAYDRTSTLVEFQMLRRGAATIKAVMWTRFVHYHITGRKKTQHSGELMSMFEEIAMDIGDVSFEQRIKDVRKAAG